VRLVTVVFPVGDLVGKRLTPEGLFNTIEGQIAPRSWRAKGGNATMEYNPLTHGLVITQTTENQRKIEELLDRMRKKASK
jgi:hypothetical protein